MESSHSIFRENRRTLCFFNFSSPRAEDGIQGLVFASKHSTTELNSQLQNHSLYALEMQRGEEYIALGRSSLILEREQ